MESGFRPFTPTLNSVLTFWFVMFLLTAGILFNQLNGSLIKHFRVARVWVSKIRRQETFDSQNPPPDTEALWEQSVDDLPLVSQEGDAEKG